MRTSIVQSRHFTRRAFLLGMAKGLTLAVLGGRLFSLQVQHAQRYRDMAQGNSVRVRPVLAQRGKILDRNGAIIARGEPHYQIILTKEGKESVKTIETLAQLLSFNEEDKADLLDKLSKIGEGQSLLIEDYLTWEQLSKVQVRAHRLSGMTVQQAEKRHYLFGSMLAPVVGYVGVLSAEEMRERKRDRLMFHHPNFRLGKTGIEKVFDYKLQGRAGIDQVEVDARGRYVGDISSDKPKPGEDVRLTIDSRLHNVVTTALKGKGGLQGEGASAVLLHIPTGQIVSLASVPSYDPNKFIGGVDSEYWQTLMDNADAPLANKAISSVYPPGSTFKIVTALAALHEGVITRRTKVHCDGTYTLGNRTFHCWKEEGHGNEDVVSALTHSCNVFFYDVAKRVGVDAIAAMARKLGLGAQTGLPLLNEKSGLIPTRAWKQKNLGEPWYKGETLNVGIGQGYLQTTPVQLALMAARVASGQMVWPELVMEGQGSSDFTPLDVDPKHLEIVRRGMRNTVNASDGIVHHVRIPEKAKAFAGKTGTAQVVGKRFEKLPKNAQERYHALFVGYAPVDKPEFAVSVVVEHGGFGSYVAAPIASQILKEAQEVGLKL